MSKRIVVTVISDLVTDQRVHKVSNTLWQNGYEVLLIGSKKNKSLSLKTRNYKTSRIRLLFQKHFLFYAEFNLRLFFRLLFTRADILLGNDLDVMPATFLAARIKRIPIVYDTHEYYMAMAGLEGKPFISRVWKSIEAFIFPRLNHIYTICDSFCEMYRRDYGKELRTVRNLPYLASYGSPDAEAITAKIDRLVPPNRIILLFQGAGINPHRGVEELVLGMQYLDPEKYHLIIVGGGDIFPLILQLIATHSLQDRISIIPKLPFEELRFVTARAHLGLTLDKGTNINHRFGLPNKIFDYLHAGVPVLSSRLVELIKIIDRYQVGSYIEDHEPRHIASAIEAVFANPAQIEQWKANTSKVKNELNWEKESQIVIDIFKQVESETVNKGR